MGLQNTAIHYTQLVNFYSFSYIFTFHLFQVYPQQFSNLILFGCLENSKHYLLIKKMFILSENTRQIFKI
jgi:hypothetical protein